MLEIAAIFKNRVFNEEKLLKYGFSPCKRGYEALYPLLDGQFVMRVTAEETGLPSVKVFDTESGEEYVLIHTPGACGRFVGTVIQACEEKLREIALSAFDYEKFKSDQAKAITAYIKKTYGNQLEFLWERTPDNAIARRADTGKWYTAILTVAREKIGLSGTESIEVIDLRETPDQVTQIVDGKKYFPGYHMNKKRWYTICLDGSVAIEELYRRVDTSYHLAKK